MPAGVWYVPGMSDPKERKIYRNFIGSISGIVAISVVGIFLGMALRNHSLMRSEMGQRARAHFRNIVLTRQWNADHGGVYVEKRSGQQSNPYLQNPDITTVDGRVFTKKNPALMTREISEYSQRAGLFSFHITSLKLLNPANRPDGFERQALEAFDRGVPEVTGEEWQKGRRLFRFMGPLRVENACLACHARQGYRVGDVRGGISVSFDIENVRQEMKLNLLVILGLGLLITTLLLLLIYRFFRRLRRDLDRARKQLAEMAATDVLTGIANRRAVLERFVEEFLKARRRGSPLGCLIFDLDNFKRINDTFGHQAGDEVLQQFATAVRQVIRGYDIFGRYGGEEFLLIAPDTDLEQTSQLAERIRQRIAERLVAGAGFGGSSPVTVSIGGSGLRPDDPHVDALIRRADEALLEAKRQGKNRSEVVD